MFKHYQAITFLPVEQGGCPKLAFADSLFDVPIDFGLFFNHAQDEVADSDPGVRARA